MTIRQSKTVANALLSKGFKEDASGHHRVFWFYVDGKKTSVRTHVSHGPPKDLGKQLIGKMARQCSLSKGQFLDLVDCPMSGEEYRQHLLNAEKISAWVETGHG